MEIESKQDDGRNDKFTDIDLNATGKVHADDIKMAIATLGIDLTNEQADAIRDIINNA